MKILITGGSGFIGSHLVDRLLNEGNEVIVIDRSIKYQNLPKHPKLKGYHYSVLDNIADLFKDIDIVYHLAALTRPQWSIKYPFETIEANVLGIVKILEHARDNNVKRVVFVSSSDMYGDQEIYPTPEDVIPHPLNFYALSKWQAEQVFDLFYKLYGLEYNIIRPFNAYGSRMPLSGIYTSAIATYINAIKNDKPFKMFGNGEQRRDFIYIDDIIDMLMLVGTSEVKCKAFNCGSGFNYSINEVKGMIEEIIGKKMPFERLPAQFEKKQTLADISKAKTLLNWKPKVDLYTGLKKTIESYE